jgi:SAM-dependent methyltransferase
MSSSVSAPAYHDHLRRFKPISLKFRGVYDRLEAGIEAARDILFDRWHRLDFGGLIPRDDLVTEFPTAQSQATAYEACSGAAVRTMVFEAMRAAARNGFAFDNFVDIGSGKGKACLYAAREFPFRRVIGVEFSPPLVAVAIRNARRLGMTNVEFVTQDATCYDLPAGNTLVMIFNPFEHQALEDFVVHNHDHFRTNQSMIGYSNDRHRPSLARLEFDTVYRDAILKRSIHQRRASAGSADS